MTEKNRPSATYDSGWVCSKCHGTERFKGTHGCVACFNHKQFLRNLKNPDYDARYGSIKKE
jgi:hypothetical protein